MEDQFNICPNCGTQIPLAEAITRKIEEKLRKEFETEARKKGKELKEGRIQERTAPEKQARRQAEELLSAEIKDLKAQLKEKSNQLEKVIKHELENRKRQRDLEDREKNLQLEVSRALDAERKKIMDESTAKTGEGDLLKDIERENQLNDMRREIEGLKNAKTELINNYLSGEEFRERIQVIVDSFAAMKKDLDAERQAMENIWAEGNKQIQKIVHNIAGMYNDIQGVTGATPLPIKIIDSPSGDE